MDFYKIITIENNNLSSLISIFEKYKAMLIQKLNQSLTPLLFQVEYTFFPDYFEEIILLELDTFISFLKKGDTAIASMRGREAKKQGLPSEIALVQFDIYYTYILENELNKNDYNTLFKVITIYKNYYTLAFNKESNEKIFSGQQQLTKSLVSTISKQKEEIALKERQLQESKMKALKEREQAKTNFLITLAHEIKTPLTIMVNAINIAKEEMGKRIFKSYKILEVEVIELRNLAVDLLDHEKILLGKILYEHNNIINISRTVQKEIELFRSLAENNKIKILSNIEKQLYIKINPRAIDRILHNIFDNAIKYNKEGGEIFVDLMEENNTVTLRIKDTGLGISAKQLPDIFKLYYQSNVINDSIRGIGIGLSIVKSILDEVKGKIQITSKENEGTEVTISFHRTEIAGDSDVIEDLELTKPLHRNNIKLKSESFDNGKNTIFVVEDNMILLEFLQSNFGREYNFYYALDGASALRKLKIMPKPDVIISDIMMDNMDGFEFLKRLKKNQVYKHIPVIFLTAKTTEEAQLTGLKLGAVDYIEKPLSIDILNEKIKSLLAHHKNFADYQIEDMERKIAYAIRSPGKEKAIFQKKIEEFNISKRESDVLKSLMEGLEISEIADQLFITEDTVRKHLQNLKDKCGVSNNIKLINLFKN